MSDKVKLKFLKAASPPGFEYLAEETNANGNPELVTKFQVCKPGDIAEVDKHYADNATRGGVNAVAIFATASATVTVIAKNGAFENAETPEKPATASAKPNKDNL